jgi:hypothetical protein
LGASGFEVSEGAGRTLGLILVSSTGSTASLFGLSTTQALVVLFVILPFAVAAIIVPLVSWRSSGGPKPVLTSEILSQGVPAEARIISVKTLGGAGFLDPRPMVRFMLMVTANRDEEPFELEVVQSFPRAATRELRPGELVEIRLTPDHTAGAILWSGG